MARVTTTLSLCLDHLYYLTADPNNDTGYTLEQVDEMKSQYGGNHMIEVSVNHPVPDIDETANANQTENEISSVDLQTSAGTSDDLELSAD